MLFHIIPIMSDDSTITIGTHSLKKGSDIVINGRPCKVAADRVLRVIQNAV